MQLFENDAAIVTGAGNGIGGAIAQALVREGVNTLFADINADTVAQAHLHPNHLASAWHLATDRRQDAIRLALRRRRARKGGGERSRSPTAPAKY